MQAINDQIEAIRSKIEKVKADPTEHQIALDEGWYEDMNANLKKLFDKKRVIIKDQTGKTFVSIEEFDAFPPEKQDKLLQSDRHIIEQK
ncbi:MAG: hypothetical protein HUJ25_12105 [Crocinitomicaceae bacterium]|nr:hypothetical protein [Crocinitomicaceae bacterium]